MRFIQIWIMPAEVGLMPDVEQKVFSESDRTNRLLRVISGEGGDAVLVHQDAHVFVAHLDPSISVSHELGNGRGVYLYTIKGDVVVNGERMTTGDAAEIWDEPGVAIEAAAWTDAEIILVDVRL
jgi:redox-sensitive bicupin YhaK (pirin superfamily)